MDNTFVASTSHLDAPWIAAHLAVLNEAAVDVRLDVDFRVLAQNGHVTENSSDIAAILLQRWSARGCIAPLAEMYF